MANAEPLSNSKATAYHHTFLHSDTLISHNSCLYITCFGLSSLLSHDTLIQPFFHPSFIWYKHMLVQHYIFNFINHFLHNSSDYYHLKPKLAKSFQPKMVLNVFHCKYCIYNVFEYVCDNTSPINVYLFILYMDSCTI